MKAISASLAFCCCYLVLAAAASDSTDRLQHQERDSRTLSNSFDIGTLLDLARGLDPNNIANAKNWLSALVPNVLVGPSSGTIIGVSTLALVIILIWIIIYSIGIVPVGSLAGRSDDFADEHQEPFAYHTRFQRNLDRLSSSVMDSVDKWASYQQQSLN